MPHRSYAFRVRLACLALVGSAHAATSYDVDYTIEFLPKERQAAVTIALDPADGRATRLDFAMDEQIYTDVTGDGQVERRGERLLWTPPKAGGELHYRYRINQERKGGGYDALMREDWVIVRGDDLRNRERHFARVVVHDHHAGCPREPAAETRARRVY